jgi:hypothetical protein
MQQLAANKPGQYFIFSITNASILAQIETFALRHQGPEAEKARGAQA